MKNSIFFTADEHYGHANVIKYCNRPFANVGEMDAALRSNMYSVFEKTTITNQAILYHVGDYSFDKSREPGPAFVRHIYLKGNHDTPNKCDAFSLVVQHMGVHINVVHWPDFADNKYAINIVGHVHGLWKYKMHAGSFLVNVGVDEWGFKPVSIDEIFQLWKHVKQGRKKCEGQGERDYTDE